MEIQKVLVKMKMCMYRHFKKAICSARSTRLHYSVPCYYIMREMTTTTAYIHNIHPKPSKFPISSGGQLLLIQSKDPRDGFVKKNVLIEISTRISRSHSMDVHMYVIST